MKIKKIPKPKKKKKTEQNRYFQILEYIFKKKYVQDAKEFLFDRDEIIKAATALKIDVPKNIGDVLYSYRYRTEPPKYVAEHTPSGLGWTLLPDGKGKYKFSLGKKVEIAPSTTMAETKVLDSTPGIIVKYSMNNEQALLAKIRYNRLIDIFTGITCYSLQNHLRTST